MNTSHHLKFLFASAVLSLSTLSQAAVYGEVQNDQSHLGFTFEQMGVKMDGSFRTFEGDLKFDSAQPEQAQVKFQVQLGSVDLGAPAFNDEVIGKDWFNTQAFPSAEFVSQSIKPLGQERYEVKGTLTIKGQSHEVAVPASFTESNGLGIFAGSFDIERGTFKIGEGIWSGFDIVANPVTVNFKITAKPN